MATLADLAREVREKKLGSPHFVKHMTAFAERHDYIDRAHAEGRVQVIESCLAIDGRKVSMAEALMLLRGYI